MNDPIVVTRELVKRGWSDIEPKLVTALASGSVTAFLVGVAKAYGFTIPETVVSALPLVCALLVGYLTPSVGTTVTKRTTTDKGGSVLETEAHSGPVVSTFTAPTTVVAPPHVSQATVALPPLSEQFTDVITPQAHEGGSDLPPWMNRG